MYNRKVALNRRVHEATKALTKLKKNEDIKQKERERERERERDRFVINRQKDAYQGGDSKKQSVTKWKYFLASKILQKMFCTQNYFCLHKGSFCAMKNKIPVSSFLLLFLIF